MDDRSIQVFEEAKGWLALGDPLKAAETLDTLAPTDRATIFVILLQIEICLRLKMLAEAAILLQSLQSKGYQGFDLYFLSARIAALNQDIPKAKEYILKASYMDKSRRLEIVDCPDLYSVFE